MEKSKIIQVSSDTHKQVKLQAVQKSISIREYIQYLADKDK